VLGLVIKFALMGTLLAAPITPAAITCAFAHAGAEPFFAGGDIVGALLGLAPQPGSHVRRQAAHEHNFHRSHKAQRTTASLKPHESQRKTLFDQADPRPRGNDVSTAGSPSADRAPDQIQAAPASIIEREAGQTVGMESVIRLANAAQNTLPPVVESKGTEIARSLEALSVVMMMVVAALGFMGILIQCFCRPPRYGRSRCLEIRPPSSPN
jgi:hypothetical protein